MTDPTPTRSEVERLRLTYGKITASPSGPYVRFTDYQALRERVEAAEAELALADKSPEYWHRRAKEAEAALAAARRAETAAWNDAIEAAGNLEGIHGYSNAVPRHRIRALRRAAPTEDR